MTKKKNESSDYSDYADITTRTDILVHDLDGKAHTFYPKDIYSISTLEAGERYSVEYMKGGSMQEALIWEDQFNILKYALGNKVDNLMTKETIEVKDNVITVKDIDNKKHVFPIKDIYALVLLPMDSNSNCSVEYLSSEKEERTGLPIMEDATITKKQFDQLKDLLDKTRYK